MHYKASLLTLGLCCSTISMSWGATVTVYGGQINYTGSVVNAPCVVSVDSQNQQVVMGQVRTNQFDGFGSWADTQAFDIVLQDCAVDIAHSAGVLFRGVTDPKDPLVFQVGGDQDAAQGIGLGIFDNKGTLMVPNSAPISFQPLTSDTNTLPFIAKYRATSRQVSAGTANVTVNFSMVYP